MASPTVALHTRTWNEQGSRTALLLHGLGSDGSTMWRLADHLARHDFRVTAPDLRGQGLSPPTASYSLEDMAADVRQLGTDWDFVAGHSLGGAVAAVLLSEVGFARRGLLIDPVLYVDEADKPALTEALLADMGDGLTMERVRAEAPQWDEEDGFRLVRASALVSPHVVRRVVADTSPWDLLPLAKRWTSAVTILAADPVVGALFTPQHTERLQGVRAEVRVVTVPQAGHSIHRDTPATVLAAIDHLLTDS